MRLAIREMQLCMGRPRKKTRSQSEVVLTPWVSPTLTGLKTLQHNNANQSAVRIRAITMRQRINASLSNKVFSCIVLPKEFVWPQKNHQVKHQIFNKQAPIIYFSKL